MNAQIPENAQPTRWASKLILLGEKKGDGSRSFSTTTHTAIPLGVGVGSETGIFAFKEGKERQYCLFRRRRYSAAAAAAAAAKSRKIIEAEEMLDWEEGKEKKGVSMWRDERARSSERNDLLKTRGNTGAAA